MEIEAVGMPAAPRRGTNPGTDAGFEGLFGLLLTQADPASGSCAEASFAEAPSFAFAAPPAAAPTDATAPETDETAEEGSEVASTSAEVAAGTLGWVPAWATAGTSMPEKAASDTAPRPLETPQGKTIPRGGVGVGRPAAERLWGYWLRQGSTAVPAGEAPTTDSASPAPVAVASGGNGVDGNSGAPDPGLAAAMTTAPEGRGARPKSETALTAPHRGAVSATDETPAATDVGPGEREPTLPEVSRLTPHTSPLTADETSPPRATLPDQAAPDAPRAPAQTPKGMDIPRGGAGVERLWSEWMRPGNPSPNGVEQAGRDDDAETLKSVPGARTRRATAVRTDASRTAEVPKKTLPGRLGGDETVADVLPADRRSDTDPPAPALAAEPRAEADPPASAANQAAAETVNGESRSVSAQATNPAQGHGTPARSPTSTEPAQQVVHAMRMAATRRGERVSVQLEPESLGRVHLVVTREGQGMVAQFRVETAEAHQALVAEAPALRRELEAQGLTLLRVSVDLDERSGAWQEARQERRPGRRARPAVEDIPVEQAAAAPLRRSWSFEARA